ncbi:sulfotransferase [Salipiger abyssi]|uniref:sulfotransferase n=1 Tax=Salipiger abyssi TaxID=1250539 RepID=UPI0040598396
MENILFVSGVSRAGTSALVNMLNAHEGMAIGQERYHAKISKGAIKPHHFKHERFVDVRRPEDTHAKGGLHIGDAKNRVRSANYIGDKYPRLYLHFDYIFETFPNAKHLYILRNPISVVESFEARNKNPDDNWSWFWRDGMKASLL